MHSIAINRKESSLDLIIGVTPASSAAVAVRKLETHGETQERSARRRVLRELWARTQPF